MLPDPKSYESWFVSKRGMRPLLPGGARERANEIRQELAALEAMIDTQREWDAAYMAGRAALNAFDRRDV